jgi:hypothetical protein
MWINSRPDSRVITIPKSVFSHDDTLIPLRRLYKTVYPTGLHTVQGSRSNQEHSRCFTSVHINYTLLEGLVGFLKLRTYSISGGGGCRLKHLWVRRFQPLGDLVLGIHCTERNILKSAVGNVTCRVV